MPNNKQEAIDFINECMDIHQQWQDWITAAGPDWADEVESSMVGDAEYHREWIKKYLKVLAVLEDAK